MKRGKMEAIKTSSRSSHTCLWQVLCFSSKLLHGCCASWWVVTWTASATLGPPSSELFCPLTVRTETTHWNHKLNSSSLKFFLCEASELGCSRARRPSTCCVDPKDETNTGNQPDQCCVHCESEKYLIQWAAVTAETNNWSERTQWLEKAWV